jgi:bacillopeptidase F
MVMSFDTKYAIETNYDNGFVEVSSDGGQTFTKVMTVTGSKSMWVTKTINLEDHSTNSNEILIRFRFESDSSVADDGWYIDNISLFEVI